MNLDDPNLIKTYDTQNMLGEIDNLPNQLESAWKIGMSLPLPAFGKISNVIVAGMGGSAIGADLVSAYAAPHSTVPILVLRDYTLPAWASGPGTLVVGSSHSGNTEEALSAYQQAVERGCARHAISTGGKLTDLAKQNGDSFWNFEHAGQPRAAVGFSFGLILALLTRLDIIPDPSAELQNAVAAMRELQKQVTFDIPAALNPAKRQAGQLMDRWVAVFGSEHLEPVARRWKGQVSELAKAWGQFEALPEANHNTLAGISNPEALFGRMITLFLIAPSNHPRNKLRAELTKTTFMLEGLTTDFYYAAGDTRMAHQWTTLLFGDYMSYFLALAYETDPTPVETLVGFKDQMKALGQ